MISRPSPKLRAYVTAGAVGLVAALAVGDPAPALVGTVLLGLGMIGLAGGSSPSIGIRLEQVAATAVEGEPTDFIVSISTDQSLGQVHVDLGLTGARILDIEGGRVGGTSSFSLSGWSGEKTIRVTIMPTTWGRAVIGPVALFTESGFGMTEVRVDSPKAWGILVLPSEIGLRRLLEPIETNLHAGDLVSSRLGPGSEFADLRAYRPGDDPRTINWRVSSRQQATWVNERHPERNGDVLLLVDAQVEPGTEVQTLVDRSVRLAAALLNSYGRHRQRLGLVTLDGLCHWVYPGTGEMHRRRLLEQLMAVIPGQVIWDAAERAVIRAARRPSFVIALTPLLSPEMAGLIHTLRRAGVDISVIAVDPGDVLPPPEGRVRSIGRRVWAMERDRLRDRLAGEGVPVAAWRDIDPAEVPLAQLSEWRSAWRRHG